MKKKLALLLALSMMLSMVPVVTFGAGRAIYTVTEPAVFSDDAGQKTYDVVVAIKANAFRSWAINTTGQSIGIIVPRGDKFTVEEVAAFTNNVTGEYVGNWLGNMAPSAAADAFNLAVTEEADDDGYYIQINRWGTIGSSDPLDDLYIKLTLKPNPDVDLVDEYYVDFFTDNEASTVISGVTKDDTLVAVKAGSWTIKAGDKVYFADIASIDTITINETVARQFAWNHPTDGIGAGTHGEQVISFVLPYGFSWVRGSSNTYLNDITATGGDRFLNAQLKDHKGASTNYKEEYGRFITSAIKGEADNRVLTFIIERTDTNTIKSPGYVEIKDMRFVASDNARPGDVTIGVYRGGYLGAYKNAQGNSILTTYPSSGRSSAATIAATIAERERDIPDPSDKLLVANYSNYGLVIEEAEEMEELVSGTYGIFEDALTSAFTITELTPNSFPTSRTETLGARFDAPEGVQFKKAYVWFGVDGKDPIIGTGKNMIDKAQPYEVNEAPDGNGVRLTPGSLYVSPPMDRRNTADVYTLSVYFEVSVIPGFVGPDDDSKDINISFEGTILDTKEIPVYESDKKTAFGKREVTVATVVDRITVGVTKATIDESNAGLYVMNRPVNDIVIKETDAGMLELNTELWVFVDSPRSADITFSTNLQPTTDTASTLRVSRATKLEVPELPTGIRFTVTRESSDEPGTITIPGGMISGWLYPRVDYELVVTGNSVGMSHDAVYYYEVVTPSSNTSMSQFLKENPALFEKSLYRAALFSYTGDTLLEVPGEPGTGVVTGPGRVKEPATFTSNTPYFSATEGKSIERPFITIPVPSLENGSGLIAARAFAEMVGIEIQYLGDSKSRMYDPYTGIEVIYSFKPGQDNSVCSVNGVPYTFRNNEGYPVSVYTLNDEWTYLPARTFGDLFGYTVTYLDPTAGGPGILYTPK